MEEEIHEQIEIRMIRVSKSEKIFLNLLFQFFFTFLGLIK